jgi:hypothetical protein
MSISKQIVCANNKLFEALLYSRNNAAILYGICLYSDFARRKNESNKLQLIIANGVAKMYGYKNYLINNNVYWLKIEFGFIYCIQLKPNLSVGVLSIIPKYDDIISEDWVNKHHNEILNPVFKFNTEQMIPAVKNNCIEIY